MKAFILYVVGVEARKNQDGREFGSVFSQVDIPDADGAGKKFASYRIDEGCGTACVAAFKQNGEGDYRADCTAFEGAKGAKFISISALSPVSAPAAAAKKQGQ